MAKSEQTKATSISRYTKLTVWERDNQCCILCGSNQAMPTAHYIPRSKGGKGIEQNVVTLCMDCHHRLDNTIERKELMLKVREYLDWYYPSFTDSKRIYKKENK